MHQSCLSIIFAHIYKALYGSQSIFVHIISFHLHNNLVRLGEQNPVSQFMDENPECREVKPKVTQLICGRAGIWRRPWENLWGCTESLGVFSKPQNCRAPSAWAVSWASCWRPRPFLPVSENPRGLRAQVQSLSLSETLSRLQPIVLTLSSELLGQLLSLPFI